MMDPWVALWFGYTAFALTVVGPIVYWAMRSGQFQDLDRARYLALGPAAVRRYEAERAKSATSTAAEAGEDHDVHA